MLRSHSQNAVLEVRLDLVGVDALRHCERALERAIFPLMEVVSTIRATLESSDASTRVACAGEPGQSLGAGEKPAFLAKVTQP